jgi:hypothetical protein
MQKHEADVAFHEDSDDVQGFSREKMLFLGVAAGCQPTFPLIKEVLSPQYHMQPFMVSDFPVLVCITKFTKYKKIDNFGCIFRVTIGDEVKGFGREESHSSVVILSVKLEDISTKERCACFSCNCCNMAENSDVAS